MEVEMVKRLRSAEARLAAFIASIAVAALVVGACSSGSFDSSRFPGLDGAPSGKSNSGAVPVALSAATAAPSAPVTGPASVLELQNQFVAVIRQVTPSVVKIETGSALGSGVIYDARGNIVTNAHVVGTQTAFTVTLSDGRSFPGKLVGAYAPDDIAVIHIDGTGLAAATWGDSAGLSVGDFVLAMGNPLGLQSSVTEGIVSALSRQVSEPTGNSLPDVIQTSAAINPGNSGGALVDLEGNVVGIPTLAATNSQVGGSAPGIGFAISSNRARMIADQLIAKGKVTSSNRAYLGVQLRDGTAGPVVVAMSADGPAAKAGIVVGDIVLALDATATTDSESLIDAIAGHKPGDSVKLKVQHGTGAVRTVSVNLGELPS
jgi:putative serine protease PepD